MSMSECKSEPIHGGATSSKLAAPGAVIAGVVASLTSPFAQAEVIGATNLNVSVPYSPPGSPLQVVSPMPGVNLVNSGKSFTVNSDPTLYTNYFAYLESPSGAVTGPLSSSSKFPVSVGPQLFNSTSPSRLELARQDTNSAGGYNPVQGPGSGYYGVSFNDGAGVRYGWVQVGVTSSSNPNKGGSRFDLSLYGWAYETTGAPINVGTFTTPVPEPSSLLLLTAGAIGLGLKRRRDSAARRAQALSH